MNVTSHWHVATGIAGYGPEDPGPALDLAGACDAVSSEAASLADFMHEGYCIHRDAEEWREAVEANEEADFLSTLSLNATFDEKRKGYPLFATEGKWEETMRWVLSGAPWDYDGGRARLYAWECSEAECLEGDDDE